MLVQNNKKIKGSMLVYMLLGATAVALILFGGFMLARYKGILYSDEYKIKWLERQGLIPKLDRTDTLKGVDANNNGIRDDIEAYIEANFTDPKQKLAVEQFARATQIKVTVDYTDDFDVQQARLMSSKAIQCISFTFGEENSAQYWQIIDDIKFMTTNTKQRTINYWKYNSALDGTVWRLLDGDTCDD